MIGTILFLFVFVSGSFAKYEPTWESIDSRPLPEWYDNGKIGIFLHWGVFSAPGEKAWLWWYWKTQKAKYAVDFMKKNFKPNFTYADFAPMFTAEFYDPDQWAKLFKKAGARYVVLTSKHHEGFTNWPSKYSFSWNSVDVGPNRDLVGELAQAIRKNTDLHFGLYHSLFEFYNPLFLDDAANNFTTDRFVKFKTMPELYEIVKSYKPDLIWSDGDWLADHVYWDSLNFLTWLYNESPVKDTVVVNDRWGKDSNCKHGGYLNCKDKFNPGVLQKRKWENAMTLDKHGWAYRKTATIDDFLTMEELLETLVQTIRMPERSKGKLVYTPLPGIPKRMWWSVKVVELPIVFCNCDNACCGGNLLLNVGPHADGRITPIFEERLLSMGEWLGVNGEAIYESKPWIYQNDTTNKYVWYTKKTTESTAVYALVLQWPDSGVLSLGAPVPSCDTTTVELLGYKDLIAWSQREGGGINIQPPIIPFNKMPCKWAWVFKLNGLKNANKDDTLRFKPNF